MIFDKARIQLYRNLIINVSQILPLFQFEQSTFGAHRPWCFHCTKLNPHLTSIFHTNYFSIPISWELYSKIPSYAADARLR
jgi:hypothetical protein